MRLHLTRLGILLALLLAACGTAATGPEELAAPGAVPASTTTKLPSETDGKPGADLEDPYPSTENGTTPDTNDDSGALGPGSDREQTPPEVLPERVPASDGPQPGGEVPDAFLTEVMGDAAIRLGVAPSDLTLRRAESVVWTDGSLGCPEPGVMYTQATVPGYWIVLEHEETELDYRTNGVSFYTPCPARAQTEIGDLPGRCANC